jgi:ubiquinone/menaquinone biosynthesis C-methylase UbiE
MGVHDTADQAPRQMAQERRVPLLARGVGTLLPRGMRVWFWRSFYGMLAGLTRGRDIEFTCMNWGYHEEGATWPEGLGVEHFSKQLYLALIRGVDLSGRRIAEISSGRGGGLATVHQHAGPAASHGVDITPGNVELCTGRFGAVPGLDFVVGNAMALPFADGALDAVLTVEASHCYPDERQFAREAARVVRPGGWLLWTDFRLSADLAVLRDALAADFELVEFRDISKNVLAAMASDAPRRQALIQAGSPRPLRGVLTYFAAASGETESVRSFQRGERIYFIMQLRRRAA